ncbi:hypothetical protein DENSPDRAFT_326522 [Dentipellis sp. KUC8613]|nr:hypothetical protein DENSPDRAFT_326522 [Dentipellis sp. KUC8613]
MANVNPAPIPERYIVPIDVNKYDLNEEETAFFKQQTGITDDEKLKQHIITAQAEAFAVYPYPCIRRFAFAKLKIAKLPAYPALLKLGKEREGAIFLDIGCCFGNDVRKAVADGYPVQNAVASDLQPGFWELGHKLFNSTPESFPVPFIAGDAFNPAHLEIVPPFTLKAPPTTPRPDLKTLTSLNPLRGHVAAIHASSFFHLFDEEQQFKLAQATAGLLSPEPGSMIFGMHGSRPTKGFRISSGSGHTMFCHGPDSWRELWDGEIFEKGTVRVETKLVEVPDEADFKETIVPDGKRYWLGWSVTRL